MLWAPHEYYAQFGPTGERRHEVYAILLSVSCLLSFALLDRYGETSRSKRCLLCQFYKALRQPDRRRMLQRSLSAWDARWSTAERGVFRNGLKRIKRLEWNNWNDWEMALRNRRKVFSDDRAWVRLLLRSTTRAGGLPLSRLLCTESNVRYKVSTKLGAVPRL